MGGEVVGLADLATSAPSHARAAAKKKAAAAKAVQERRAATKKNAAANAELEVAASAVRVPCWSCRSGCIIRQWQRMPTQRSQCHITVTHRPHSDRSAISLSQEAGCTVAGCLRAMSFAVNASYDSGRGCVPRQWQDASCDSDSGRMLASDPATVAG